MGAVKEDSGHIFCRSPHSCHNPGSFLRLRLPVPKIALFDYTWETLASHWVFLALVAELLHFSP